MVPMDNQDIRRVNLEKLIIEVGGKTALAKMIGHRVNYINQMHTFKINPKRKLRNISDTMARDLEGGAGKERGWMDVIHADSNSGEKTGAARFSPVYLLSWAQAGGVEGMMSHDGAPVVQADGDVGEGSFALRVRGDSMVDTAGGISFPHGAIIVVDPTKRANPGDNVVVRLPGADEAVFKALEFDGAQYFLKPLNQRYPIIPMPFDALIVGVVVAVQVKIMPRSP